VLDREVAGLAATLGYSAPPAPHAAAPVPAAAPATAPQPGPDSRRCVVLVPVASAIEPACEAGLRALEARGYPVRRVYGYAAIDQARNQMATDALAAGFPELIWVDADVAFDPDAVERLRKHGLPVCCGLYPKKGRRAFACDFTPATPVVPFGDGGGLIEVGHAGFGFMHTRREVYEKIQAVERLPVCNEQFGERMVPFFQPMVVASAGGHRYLAEDYAFCERARRAGFSVIADTSIRLWHWGVPLRLGGRRPGRRAATPGTRFTSRSEGGSSVRPRSQKRHPSSTSSRSTRWPNRARRASASASPIGFLLRSSRATPSSGPQAASAAAPASSSWL
jgi:hypothetical protein